MTTQTHVFLNDKKIELSENQSLHDFLNMYANSGPYAVAINNTFVPKTQYEQTLLQADDRIDLVAPMMGG